MKKFFLVVVCLVVLLISTSCSGKFDRTKTDDIYCQIVLSDNRKINLRLDYDRAPITVDNFIDLVEVEDSSKIIAGLELGEEADAGELSILDRTVSLVTVNDFQKLLSKDNIVALLIASVIFGLPTSFCISIFLQ